MLIPLQSDVIDAVSYNSDDRRLYVQLKGGNAYSYEGVPWRVFKGLLEAASHGAYFNRIVKQFDGRRVEDGGWGEAPGGEWFG
ncbi:MAG: KTSC domain-containing protein [Litorimonas sp.]